MKETRIGKYGKNLAVWIEHTINTIPKNQRENYKTRFLEELDTYSLEPRKKGQPWNEGCVYELSDLANVADISDPKQFAKLVKESIHLMYQKGSSAVVLGEVKNYLKPKSNL